MAVSWAVLWSHRSLLLFSLLPLLLLPLPLLMPTKVRYAQGPSEALRGGLGPSGALRAGGPGALRAGVPSALMYGLSHHSPV